MTDDRYYIGWRIYRDGSKITGYFRYGFFIQRLSSNSWIVWRGVPEKNGAIKEGMQRWGKFPTFKKARKWVKKKSHV